MQIAILGSGPAGLTTAISLSRRGHRVIVLEKESELRPGGIGLLLQNSPLRALDALGLLERCAAEGLFHDHIAMHDRGGAEIGTITVPALVPGYGSMLAISRHRLARTLRDAALDAGVEIRFGAAAERMHLLDGSVAIETAAGDRLTADVVVVAEGIHSATRERLFPSAPQPEPTGQMIWRVSAPRPPHLREYTMHDGGPDLGKIGVVPISDDEVYLWMLQRATDPLPPRGPGLLPALRDRLAPFEGAVAEFVPLLRDDVDVRRLHALYVPSSWSTGRVVMIGDAVHAPTPHLAYGVGQAIEDALVLGEVLDAPDDIEAALERFVERRRERCRLVVETSVRLGEWEVDPPEDRSLPGRLTGQTLARLSEPY